MLYSHRGRLRGGRPLPVAGIFGAGKEGLALEPAPPGAGRPTPLLVPDSCGLRVGWGLRATALREGRPHTPPTATEASWAAIGDGPFCCQVIRIGRPPIGAPDMGFIDRLNESISIIAHISRAAQ